MIKKSIIIFIILSAFEFFDLNLFGPDQIKVFDAISLVLMGFILLFNHFYKEKAETKKYYALSIKIIWFSVFLGMIGAYVFFKQDFLLSFQVSRQMYYYMLYFLLFSLELKIEEIEKIIVISASLYCVAYLANLLLPQIFFTKTYEDPYRLMTRIYLPGSLINVLAYFYYVSKIIFNRKIKYLPLILLSIIVMILTGTRMVIFPVIILTFFFIIKEIKVNRFATLFTLIVSAIIIVFAFSNIFDSLFFVAKSDVTEGQSGTLQIRIDAVIYFFNLFFPSFSNYIIGNGFWSSYSDYGRMIDDIRYHLNYYQADIGILGDFTKMGIVYLVGLILIFVNVFRSKVNNYNYYLRYFFYYVLISCLTLVHFGSSEGIVCLCLAFYLLDQYNNPKLDIKEL